MILINLKQFIFIKHQKKTKETNKIEESADLSTEQGTVNEIENLLSQFFLKNFNIYFLIHLNRYLIGKYLYSTFFLNQRFYK